MQPTQKKYGFSLLELLVVIAIMAIIAAVVIPQYKYYEVRTKIQSIQNIGNQFMQDIQTYYIMTGRWPAAGNLPYKLANQFFSVMNLSYTYSPYIFNISLPVAAPTGCMGTQVAFTLKASTLGYGPTWGTGGQTMNMYMQPYTTNNGTTVNVFCSINAMSEKLVYPPSCQNDVNSPPACS